MRNIRRSLNLTVLGPVIIILLILASACGVMDRTGGRDDPQELRVFAASSLTDALTEVSKEFEGQNPDVTVTLNFASSSQLAAQLRERVAADIYASANNRQMERVIEAGLIDPADVHTFVQNRLIVLVPDENPAGIERIEDLGDPDVELILAIAGVPVRDYADQVIATLPVDVQEAVYGNLVSEASNVRQVVTKIALGEADAGIVYRSDLTPDIRTQVRAIEIAESINVTASYPIAVLKDSQFPDAAGEYVEFLLSDAGQMILEKWGFDAVNRNSIGISE